MSVVSKLRFGSMAIVAAGAGVCAITACFPGEALARPNYMAIFREQYPAYGQVRCGFCHPEPSKRSHTEYSAALKEALGVQNVKDKDAIRSAMREVESKLPAP
jgi:hypothetical protein